MKGPYFLALLFSAALLGQSTEPRFEVVSIRTVDPNAPPIRREIGSSPVLPGGQYVDSRETLYFMIAYAYNVKNPAISLRGLPNWAKEQSFNVAAKPASGFPALSEAENYERVRPMMRAMLEDRFHLQIHKETRRGNVLRLEVAKGGLKLKEVDAPAPPEKSNPVGAAMGNDGGRMIGKKSTMDEMARMLLIFLHEPVEDGTGLKGYYDFDVKWSAPESTSEPGLGASGISLLISTLKNQLGLNLVKTTGDVEYWVVDHIEPPGEN